jgi:hypothetical protein
MVKNQNHDLKSELDTEKFKSRQLSMALENRDQAYSELKMKLNDMQYKLDKARRDHVTEFMPTMINYKFNSSLYESPHNDYFKSSWNENLSKLTDLLKSDEPLREPIQTSEKSLANAVTLNLNAEQPASSPSVIKSKILNQKQESVNVGAALMWDDSSSAPSTSQNMQNLKREFLNSNTFPSVDLKEASEDRELQGKIDQLNFNIAEEKRLTQLIQNPPVQYRKYKKQQQLKEELKNAQRKIYELNFSIKQLTQV